MISMLCLGNRIPAPMLSCIPSSTLSNSKRTKLQFRFGEAFTSLGNIYARQRSLRASYPAIRALGGSPILPQNDKNNNRAARTMAGASLALACVIGIIASFKMNPKAIAGPKEMFQKTTSSSGFVDAFGGKAALESLLNVPVSLASNELNPPDKKFSLPKNPSMDEVEAIKRHAVQLMKYGKAEDAEKFLENAYEKCQKGSESAYNVEMTLVEILICKGKYEEALKCNCLNDNEYESQKWPSDSRFPLYKAIIHTMLDDKEEATRYWGEYLTVEDPRSLGIM